MHCHLPTYLQDIQNFIQQGCITFIKSDHKDMYNVAEDLQLKYCSFELIFIYFFKSWGTNAALFAYK